MSRSGGIATEYEALGFRFRLEGDLAERIAPLFAGLARPDPGSPTSTSARADRVGQRLRLRLDDEGVFETADLGALVHQLMWEVTRRAVEARGDGVILHAATVVCGGTTVVISGRSGAGKSTLATALVERGATYVTDEATEVDERGHVVAGLVRPIHLSRASIEMVAPTESPSDVVMPGGGRYLLPVRSIGRLPDAPTVIVLLRDGDGALRSSPASRSDLIAHLARERFPTRATGQRWLDSLKTLSSRVSAVTVSGGSVIDRAYLTEELANQEKVIAPR